MSFRALKLFPVFSVVLVACSDSLLHPVLRLQHLRSQCEIDLPAVGSLDYHLQNDVLFRKDLNTKPCILQRTLYYEVLFYAVYLDSASVRGRSSSFQDVSFCQSEHEAFDSKIAY